MKCQNFYHKHLVICYALHSVHKGTGSATRSEESLWLGCMKKNIVYKGTQYTVCSSVLVDVWERLFSIQMSYAEITALRQIDKSSVSVKKKKARWHDEKERGKEGWAKGRWGVNALSMSPCIKSYLAEHQDNCIHYSFSLSFCRCHRNWLDFSIN